MTRGTLKLVLRDNTARKLATLARHCKGRPFQISNQVEARKKLRMSEIAVMQFVNYMRRKKLVEVMQDGLLRFDPTIPDKPSSAILLITAERLLSNHDVLSFSEFCAAAEREGVSESGSILRDSVNHGFIHVDDSQELILGMTSRYWELRNYVKFLARKPRNTKRLEQSS